MPANSAPPDTARPLDDLHVVVIGESIAAAVVGMTLGDFGADVLLVEPPSGSRLRAAPAWTSWSRALRTEDVDLTTDAGRARITDIAETADVALVALEPATADHLGVDGPTLCVSNPRLVHCEVTGFGRGHPLSDVPGHDALVSCAAGRAYEFGVIF